MAINIENETLLTLTEATRVLPKVNGRKPAVSTLWRWCRKGLRGVRLDYLRIGRNIVTSPPGLLLKPMVIVVYLPPICSISGPPNEELYVRGACVIGYIA